MFNSYLKIALRILRQQKVYAFINIFGLAVGIACCLLIVLFVQHELSYDRYHERGDRIYRVITDRDAGSMAIHGPFSFGELALEIEKALPEVQGAVRIKNQNSALIKFNGKFVSVENVLYTDASFFDIFSFPLVRGDVSRLLEQNSAVITASIAEKLFGDDDPIGKVIYVQVRKAEEAFVVNAIAEDVPGNSHFTFTMLLPFQTLYGVTAINNNQFWTYVLLREDHSVDVLEGKLPVFARQYHGEDYIKQYNFRYELQPLKDIYLGNEYAPNKGDERYIAIFSAIALLILLTACANFMNLAIARSFKRSKEVGVRKVMGARRGQLIRQFLGESMLLCLLAIPLALVLVEFILPMMNAMVGKEIILDLWENAAFLIALLCIVLFVGIVAGSYPALFLSAFKPQVTLKGRFSGRLRGAFLRKGLIVFQFLISITLISGTLIIQRQLQFIQEKKLGFETEQVVFIPLGNNAVRQKSASLKNELLKHTSIVNVSACAGVPTQNIFWGMLVGGVHVAGSEAGITMHVAGVDENFLATLGMELVAGRDFSKAFKTDATQACLINETAAKRFGFKTAQAALGKQLDILGRRDGASIVGVVKDFHFKSLHHEIEPFLLFIDARRYRTLAVRMQSKDMSETLAYIEKQWEAFAPNMPLEISFLDERIVALYRNEQRIEKIFFSFAFLAIFLACLGLFGLAAFTAERRTKEIGVRKVLGATVTSVVAILSKDFVKLVFLANLIAWPIVWFAMNKWLQEFAYRIEIGWWVFALAGGLALVIAFLTVSTQAIRAALANPVDSLRYE